MGMAWHSQGDVSVLALTGRLDSFSAPAVAEWFDEAVTHQPANVVVDLTRTTFIDSTGLAILVRGKRRCRQQDGDLVLAGLQQPVRVIFEVTRLDRAFGIFPDEAEAVASLAGAPRTSR